MHNSFILQQYVCYTTLLNMFRAARCSSSGGPIVSPQPLVSSPSVSSRTVCRWRADWELPNRQLWTRFPYDICQETAVCENLSYCVWTQSVFVQHTVVQHTVAQICLTVYGSMYERTGSAVHLSKTFNLFWKYTLNSVIMYLFETEGNCLVVRSAPRLNNLPLCICANN